MDKVIKQLLQENFEGSGHFNIEQGDSNYQSFSGLAKALVDTYFANSTSLWFGNGGSLTDADHFVTELVGGFKIKDKLGISAISLSNPAIISAIGNDYGFGQIFSRQVDSHHRIAKVAVEISTSGNSEDVYFGLKQAKAHGMKTGYLSGQKEGKYHKEIAGVTDYLIAVNALNTPHVQEVHIKVLHTLAEIVERIICTGIKE